MNALTLIFLADNRKEKKDKEFGSLGHANFPYKESLTAAFNNLWNLQ